MNKVIVTGASRGIGEAITALFLQKGVEVIGTAVQSPFPDAWEDSGSFTGIHADLNNENELKKKLKPVIDEEMPGVLVNNAGIFEECGFDQSDDNWLENWDKTLTVNLRSAALLSRWFINMHINHGTEGIVINVASRAAYRGDGTQYTAYAASKAGLVAFTKSIARGFGRSGIYAYSIAPGFIETDMAAGEIQKIGKEKITENSAFDDLTKPGEVAEMVCWLAEGKVKHSSGSTFHINGGSYVI